MPNPLENIESKQASTTTPEPTFDPVALLAEPLEVSHSHKVLAVSALGGLSATGLKLGADSVAVQSGWLRVSESSLRTGISESAPGLARTYLEHASPTAMMAREATANAASFSRNLASTTRDFACGARFYRPGMALDPAATETMFSKLADSSMKISANASPREVLAYSRQHLNAIAGQAEQQTVQRGIRTLESQLAMAERPMLHATRVGVVPSVLQGAAVGTASYVIDEQLSKAAKLQYGEDSELGRVLEPTLTGAFLTGAGAALGSGWRSKVALAGAGWLTGKAANYFEIGR